MKNTDKKKKEKVSARIKKCQNKFTYFPAQQRLQNTLHRQLY